VAYLCRRDTRRAQQRYRLPRFFAAWIGSAGMNMTSPAFIVVDDLTFQQAFEEKDDLFTWMRVLHDRNFMGIKTKKPRS
jgi:hypothetical protein